MAAGLAIADTPDGAAEARASADPAAELADRAAADAHDAENDATTRHQHPRAEHAVARARPFESEKNDFARAQAPSEPDTSADTSGLAVGRAFDRTDFFASNFAPAAAVCAAAAVAEPATATDADAGSSAGPAAVRPACARSVAVAGPGPEPIDAA